MILAGIVGAFLLGTVFGYFSKELFSEELWIDVVPVDVLPPNGELPQWYNPLLAPSRPVETIGPRYLDMEA